MDLLRKLRKRRQEKSRRQNNTERIFSERKVKNMLFDDYLNEQLQDPEFKREWDDIQPEMDVIRAMIKARNEQHLTQKELSNRTGINQADISKLENGTRNPSLKMLKRLAEGMGMQLKIDFVPMQTLRK